MLKYAQTKGLSAESIKVWKAHQDIIWDVFTVFFWYDLPCFQEAVDSSTSRPALIMASSAGISAEARCAVR